VSNQEQTASVHVHRDDVGSRMGMWLFLFTELILFGGLFFTYSVYRFLHQQDFHVAAKSMNVFIGTANTLILLTSSLTIALSIVAMQNRKKILSLSLQGITVIFGLLFLVNKYIEWSTEIGHGNYPGSPELVSQSSGHILFFGLYYVMTGLHGLHVIVGMVLIMFMMRFTIKDVITPDSYVKLEAAGLYWHLVDIIWIFLFPLFYLIT
jgi:cytochrome c oxidase subunit III